MGWGANAHTGCRSDAIPCAAHKQKKYVTRRKSYIYRDETDGGTEQRGTEQRGMMALRVGLGMPPPPPTSTDGHNNNGDGYQQQHQQQHQQEQQQQQQQQQHQEDEQQALGRCSNNDIFDFRMDYRGGGGGHPVDAGTLSVRSASELDAGHDHLTMASARFAQQLGSEAIHEQHQFMDNGFSSTAEMTSLFLQSKKFVKERDYESTIMGYLTFAQAANLKSRDVGTNFKRSILSSMKLTSTAGVCAALDYAAPSGDLTKMEGRKANVYGDYSEWEKILQVLSFDEDVVRDYLLSADSDFGAAVPTIKFVLTTLETVGADAMSMSDKLKVYLLTNIKAVSGLVAATAFFADVMPVSFPAQERAFVFTSEMADARFTQTQFMQDIAWLLTAVVVSPSFEAKCGFFMDTRESMLQWSQQEVAKLNVGRVRLRYRAGLNATGAAPASSQDTGSGGSWGNGGNGSSADPQAVPATHTAGAASQLSQLHEDSLHGWTLRARVPPAISHKSKLMGYVAMSQTAFVDPGPALRSHFAHNADICDNMLAQRVYKPHAASIIEFLRLLAVHVTPFVELSAFRDECFANFSYTDSKDLSWLKFLQLYIASYQQDDIWPVVWKAFCPVMSHQVLIAVSTFRKKYSYALESVVEVCMRTEEAPTRLARA
jgi:hypothetical protein